MNKIYWFAFVFGCFSSVIHAQQDAPVERYHVTETDGLRVNIKLGSDGLRGGSQLLLVFEMSNGSLRRFDLNRSRTEWPGGAEKEIEISVVPAVRYSDVSRFGLEWHGSRGDAFQEQDDIDIASLQVFSRAINASAVIFNGKTVEVAVWPPASKTALMSSRERMSTSVRLENDQNYWFGSIHPRILNIAVCDSDRACDDGNFCNGPELCSIGSPSADPRGCIRGQPPCGIGKICNESSQSCSNSTVCEDRDGDGHLSSACGGDDCDDNNPNRYPGNIEVNDAADRDEDCDPNTHGIFQGAASTQICDGPNGVVLVDAREQFTRARCTTSTVCVQQPNGTGICMPQPDSYQPPTAAQLPTGPQMGFSNNTSAKKLPITKTKINDLLKGANTTKEDKKH